MKSLLGGRVKNNSRVASKAMMMDTIRPDAFKKLSQY